MDVDKAKKKLDISRPYVVAMVASFSANKDYSTYIKAALKILKTRTDITFLAIGDGPNFQYIKSMAEVYKNNIMFLGNIDRVEELISICDVGVLSTYTEGISNALLEFCALGVPVVATQGSGNEEIVKNGINGFLCKEQDPEDLAKKILTIIDNPNLKRTLGIGAINIVKKKFSIDTMINSYMDIYKKLLDQH